MQKLHLALDVYRGLGVIPVTRADTLAKAVNMLLHPFPKVRMPMFMTLIYVDNEPGTHYSRRDALALDA
jgi:hypothetical protein